MQRERDGQDAERRFPFRDHWGRYPCFRSVLKVADLGVGGCPVAGSDTGRSAPPAGPRRPRRPPAARSGFASFHERHAVVSAACPRGQDHKRIVMLGDGRGKGRVSPEQAWCGSRGRRGRPWQGKPAVA